MGSEINLGNMDDQVRELLRLRKSADLSDIKHLILPYITVQHPFPETKDEVRSKFLKDLDADEAEAAVADEMPADPFISKWNKFYLCYVIAWELKFPDIYSFDYVTAQMMEAMKISEEDLFNAASANLEGIQTETFVVSLSNDASFVSKPYFVKSSLKTVPALDTSLLFLAKKLQQGLYDSEKTIYLLPMYREGIFLTDSRDFILLILSSDFSLKNKAFSQIDISV